MHAVARCRLLRLLGLGFLGIAIFGTEGARADEPASQTAADRRGLDQIEFQGETFFPPADLRKALADDPEFQLLAHPSLRLEEFLTAICKRLTAGYHRLGFPQPEVAARWDEAEQRIIVDITAGKRYRKGHVEIVGTTRISKQVLEDWIFKPRLPQDACPITIEIGQETVTRWVKDGHIFKRPQKPIWIPGQIVSFHPPDLDYQRKELLRCCAAQGYFNADLSAHVRPEDDETATLVITVMAEGERSTLGEIEVTGLSRNSREDLLAFLGLRAGMEITETLKAELLRKLFDSGKFLEHKVRLGTPEGNSVPLQIDLYESDEAALLTEPQPPAEEAACRLAGWLNQLQVAQVDLVVEAQLHHQYNDEEHPWAADIEPPKSPHLYTSRIVFSPSNQSVEAEVHRSTGTNGPAQFSLTLSADDAGFSLKIPHRGECFSIPRLNGQVAIQIVGRTFRPNQSGDHSALQIGAGMGRTSASNLPVAFEVLVSPAFVFRQFSNEGTKFVVEGDRGILVDSDIRLEMDIKTGRLVELHVSVDGDQFLVKTGSEVQHAVAEKESSKTDDLRLASNIAYPGTSALSFALNGIDPLWLAWNNGPETLPDALARAERGIGIAQKILHADVLSPLDKLLSRYLRWIQNENVETEFQIPPSESQYFPIFFKAGNEAASELLTPDSWGRRITHDCFLAISNLRRPEATEIFRALCEDIESEKLGPLAAWYAARLCSFFLRQPTDCFAEMGLEELSLENVQEDVKKLLTPGAPLTGMAESLIASIAATADDEWKALVKSLLPTEMHRPALAVGRICRESKDNPRAALSAIVARLYPDIIEPLLQEELELMAGRPQENEADDEDKYQSAKDKLDQFDAENPAANAKMTDGLLPEIPDIFKSPLKEEQPETNDP